MSETYEDEHGVWEFRQEAGRTISVLIQPKEKPKPKSKAKKQRAKKGGKKNAGSEKGN